MAITITGTFRRDRNTVESQGMFPAEVVFPAADLYPKE